MQQPHTQPPGPNSDPLMDEWKESSNETQHGHSSARGTTGRLSSSMQPHLSLPSSSSSSQPPPLSPAKLPRFPLSSPHFPASSPRSLACVGKRKSRGEEDSDREDDEEELDEGTSSAASTAAGRKGRTSESWVAEAYGTKRTKIQQDNNQQRVALASEPQAAGQQDNSEEMKEEQKSAAAAAGSGELASAPVASSSADVQSDDTDESMLFALSISSGSTPRSSPTIASTAGSPAPTGAAPHEAGCSCSASSLLQQQNAELRAALASERFLRQSAERQLLDMRLEDGPVEALAGGLMAGGGLYGSDDDLRNRGMTQPHHPLLAPFQWQLHCPPQQYLPFFYPNGLPTMAHGGGGGGGGGGQRAFQDAYDR